MHKLSQVLKGEIGFDSGRVDGTTFWLRLPPPEAWEHSPLVSSGVSHRRGPTGLRISRRDDRDPTPPHSHGGRSTYGEFLHHDTNHADSCSWSSSIRTWRRGFLQENV